MASEEIAVERRPSEARGEYESRLSDRRHRAASMAQRERQIGNARLAVFLFGLALVWLIFARDILSSTWLVVPLAAFIGLMTFHASVIPQRRRADRAVAFYEDGMARLDDHWENRSPTGERFEDALHPYSRDLDLFGRGSLFQLLCTARTTIGENTLARWLCTPAAAAEIGARQVAVAELRGELDLREDLALTGADLGSRLHPEELARWARSNSEVGSTVWRAIAPLAVLTSVLAYLTYAAGVCGPAPLALALAIQAGIGVSLRPRVQAALRAVELPGRDLALLSQVLSKFESREFEAPRLRDLQATLQTRGVVPSHRVAQLSRLIVLLDARRNQFFAPIAPLLLWATQLCMAIDAWRRVSGAAVPLWIEAVGEFEALCAIAAYAYERDDAIFPQIADQSDAEFEAEGIGHPLLPRDSVVRNDLTLSDNDSLLVVSGSNMSGKSTLLRTIGCNAVLAQMGAPVCARRLRLSPLAVATSMRVDDSLRGGTSRFYAEIKRLRQLVDVAATQPPVLFLLDEILHGTNSHDRRIGAEVVVRTLLDRGAVGLVTTHDLTLSQIADNLAPRARNVHFADHLEDGVMVFDYRMHPGVVTKSNALDLMRAVGLIPDE